MSWKIFQRLFRGLVGFSLVILPNIAQAHCPLCTVGAGAAAALAAWLGVKIIVIGVFLGAFALAMGLWIARLVKYKFPYKGPLLGVVSFLFTIFPLQPLFQDYTSLYITWGGEYGSIFNRTYVLDRFVIGAVIGAVILTVAPFLSRWIQKKRGKLIPYQGITIVFAALVVVALILQFFL